MARYKAENFKSNFEKEVWKQLRHEVNNDYKKIEATYESTRIAYTSTHYYKPDFVLYNPKNNRTIYIECKGYLRPEDITKLNAVRKQNPDLDIRILFWTNNKMNKKVKIRYDEWAYKNKFLFAFREIPKEWFNELLETPIDNTSNNS